MWPMFPMDDSHDYNVPNHVSIHITSELAKPIVELIDDHIFHLAQNLF
jgi:hypothetical protein